MRATPLNDRKKEILKTLIATYIATGEPVGSKQLAHDLDDSLSSATLRNEMAELARMGYIEQPHTSAGRIPSDEGYRFYVDNLMPQRPLRARESATIRSVLQSRQDSPSELMMAASHILSSLSGQLAFVVAPPIACATIQRIELVRLPHPRILTILVSVTGLVTNRVIELQEEISASDLQACANYINAHFSGLSLSAIRDRLLALMQAETWQYQALLKHVICVAQQAFPVAAPANEVYLDGPSHLLDQPELGDIHRMRTILKTFEEKSRLVKILTACMASNEVRIIIGQENPDPDLRVLTLVTASYSHGENPEWGLGVVGSTRMEYNRMIALVAHVAQCVHNRLEETEL